MAVLRISMGTMLPFFSSGPRFLSQQAALLYLRLGQDLDSPVHGQGWTHWPGNWEAMRSQKNDHFSSWGCNNPMTDPCMYAIYGNIQTINKTPVMLACVYIYIPYMDPMGMYSNLGFFMTLNDCGLSSAHDTK